MMKRAFDIIPWVGLILFGTLLLMMAGDSLNINQRLSITAHAATPASDKYDGDCTGHETVGRCADKCPAPTPLGAYNQLGTDPTTGAAICHFVYADACPYTEAVSATDPLCAKSAPQQPAATTPVVTTPAAAGCVK